MTVTNICFKLPALLLVGILMFFVPVPGESDAGAQTVSGARQATGGAQTLADILARQKGLKVNNDFRRNAIGNPDQAASIRAPLGTLGGVSNAEVWRALRFGEADVTVSTRLPAARATIQSTGMTWLKFRRGPLITYGGGLLVAVIVLLAAVLAIHGRFRLARPPSGVRILRFSAMERFSHWLLAGSFVILGLTGLMQLMGRAFIIPLIGKDAFAPIALAGKWAHNNLAWAFILGLILTFVLWVAKNIPERGDIIWLANAGGLFSKGEHPPSKKFNAGQKLVFWSVILLGSAISLLGLSLLFPFDLPIFSHLFHWLNGLGLSHLFGAGALPERMPLQQEMQLTQAAHAILAIILTALILGHIYIGSVGMEGALDAMVSGTVDEEWAKEHHSLWLESVRDEEQKTPASENIAAKGAAERG